MPAPPTGGDHLPALTERRRPTCHAPTGWRHVSPANANGRARPIHSGRDSAARHERQDCGNAGADCDPKILLLLRPRRSDDEADRLHRLIGRRERASRKACCSVSLARAPANLICSPMTSGVSASAGRSANRLNASRAFSPVLVDLREIVSVIPPHHIVQTQAELIDGSGTSVDMLRRHSVEGLVEGDIFGGNVVRSQDFQGLYSAWRHLKPHAEGTRGAEIFLERLGRRMFLKRFQTRLVGAIAQQRLELRVAGAGSLPCR